MQALSTADKPYSDNAVDRTADTAHHVVDTLADQALTGIGVVSGTAHVAVNRAADVVENTANWVAQVPRRIGLKKARLADTVFATIKARPFLTLGGAIALGVVLGRLARR